MSRLLRTVLAAAGASAASAVVLGAAGAAGRTLPAPITLRGVSGVVPGMTKSAVEAAWGVKLTFLGEPPCQTAIVLKGSMRGYAIFERGKFSAAFFDRGAQTGLGIRIGSTLSRLRTVHGKQLTVRNDQYVPGAKNYFLRRPQKPYRWLRFDVSPRKRVTEIAYGNRAAFYSEACA